jgi:iron complex transport system permease protein
VCLGGLLCSYVVAMGVGSSSIDLREAFAPTAWLTQVRLPRVLLAALSGSALSVGGAVLQAVLQNPLADPYVMGVSGGAALGGVVALVAGLSSPYATPLLAFAGALLSVLLLLGLSHLRQRSDPLTLLLSGTVFNATCAAAVTLVKLLRQTERSQDILFWLLGNIGVESPATLWALGLYSLLGFAVVMAGSGALNVLCLGDEAALNLGLPVSQVRLVLLCAAALLVGAAVAFVGLIGFLGLLVPHAVRRWVGADHRHLLPACAVCGAAALMLCDALSRLSFYALGTEVPVGAMTACCGGPYLLLQIYSAPPGQRL